MKKLLSLLLIICSIGVAYADDKSTVTSLKYVTDELNTRQDKFGANDGKAMTFTNVAGGNLPRDVKESLGTSTSDNGLPTVSAVNTGIATKQDEIGAANTNTVVTYTGTPGTLGQKGIYQDTGTYAAQSDNLIQASTFNAALRNGLENEFLCADRDPVSNQCWLWTIHNEENVGKNLFDINTITNNIRYDDSGEIVADSFVWSSDYIPVLPNTTYTYSFTRGNTSAGIIRINLFDKQKNWLSVTKESFPSGGASVAVTETTPSNAYYIRTSQYKTVNNVQFELGSTATPYEPYNPNSIQVPGKNLFDSGLFDTYSSVIKYTTFSIANGSYIFSTPDFPVGAGGASNVFIFAGETSSGASSSANGVTSSQARTITVTDGKYTVAYRSSNANNTNNPADFKWQLERGDTATPYEPYTEETVNLYIPQNQ